MTLPRRVVIIAGPNGAGKTTFASQYLLQEAGRPEVINADRIAKSLSPWAPESHAFEAGRIRVVKIRSQVRSRLDFSFETPLGGTGYAKLIPRWQEAGYRVRLLFLSLPTVEIALARIRARVAQGGHEVPEGVVRGRFARGLLNFERLYRRRVDSCILYENSGPAPVVLESGDRT